MADPYLQQLMDSGTIDERLGLLMQAMKRGQGMQAVPSPQGMAVGGTYRASSPLEHLATALSRIQGGRAVSDAEREAQGLITKRGEAFAAPPPQEWGAPPGVTRQEAIKAGWINRPNTQAQAQQQPSSLARLFAERDALPPNDPRRAIYDAAIEQATTRKGPSPHYTFLPTGEGYVAGDARTGRVSPVLVDGRRPKPAASDPDLQGRLAEEKAKGVASGEAVGKARTDLPRAKQQAEETLGLTEDLLKHPGFEQAVGTSSVLGIQKIPGTNARDFEIRLNQLRGKQFLEAFNSLKGGGQITEAEGRKATEAMARMELSASEPEFIKAVRDFQAVIKSGLERVSSVSGQPTVVPGEAPKVRTYNPATGKLE